MKKRFLCLALSLLLLCGLLPASARAAENAVSVWDGTVGTGFAGGKGTAEKPYLIEAAQELAWLAASVNGGNDYSGKYIFLQTDLDLSGIPWTPIGTEDCKFKGTFDGNSHVISNLYINAPASDYQGLFGYAFGTIQKFRLDGVSVTGNTYVGAVLGYGGNIYDCNISGEVSGISIVGGVVGNSTGSGSEPCVRCVNQASVFAQQDYAGGIAGHSWRPLLCVNHGTVDARGSYVGGIAGKNYGSMRQCINTGTVGGMAKNDVGGLSGGATSGETANCCNLGKVAGIDCIGGIIGYLDRQSYITNCYNAGEVSATGSYEGSILGRRYSFNSSATNCYALAGTNDYLAEDSSELSGAAFVDAVNTAAFAATLNGNVDTNTYGVWLQDPNVYGGNPYFEPRTVLRISVTAYPKKTAYLPGEVFDPAGLEVSAFCTDGSSYAVSLSELTFFPRTALTEDTGEVKIFRGTLTTSVPVVVSASVVPEYEITELVLRDGSGNAVSGIPAGKLRVTVALKRVAAGADTMVAVASYRKSGQFQELAVFQVDEPVGATTYISFLLDNSSGQTGELKAFVIRSFADMTPLSEAVSVSG